MKGIFREVVEDIKEFVTQGNLRGHHGKSFHGVCGWGMRNTEHCYDGSTDREHKIRAEGGLRLGCDQ